MRRIPVSLLALLVAFASHAFTQDLPPGAPSGRPGTVTPGAQRPGMPPRDRPREAAQTGTATLRGRVVAGDSGVPLRRAQIVMTSVDAPQQLRRVTTSDGEGRYEFVELPAGRFTINAIKAGYVTLQYGQRRPYEQGTPVNLGEGSILERVDFALPRGSVISARITDEFGEPLAGVMVQVQRYQYGPDGQRRLTTAIGAPSPFSGTDDRGEFRAYGLMPGEYVVLASMRNLGGIAGANLNDSAEGFSPTYYPGTVSADQAQVISLGVGQEVPVQFSMITARLGRISGTVVDSQGNPAAGASLSIMTATGTGMSSYGAGQVAADGSFVVAGVAPGEHTLRVQLRTPAPGEFASVPVVVGGDDLIGLHVTLGTGARVTGQVVFDGTAERTGAPGPLRVTAQPVDPQQRFAMLGSGDPLANGTPDEAGHFALSGVSGRVFFGAAGVPPGWGIKEVTLAGDDVTDLPVDVTGRAAISDLRIVLTDMLTNIAGQVTDARGAPVRDYVVVIQPVDQKEPVIAARWIRTVRPDTDGRFQTRGMRPGRYVATAIEALEQGRQFAPEFQQQLRVGAREFSVEAGESVSLDLRLTPGL